MYYNSCSTKRSSIASSNLRHPAQNPLFPSGSPYRDSVSSASSKHSVALPLAVALILQKRTTKYSRCFLRLHFSSENHDRTHPSMSTSFPRFDCSLTQTSSNFQFAFHSPHHHRNEAFLFLSFKDILPSEFEEFSKVFAFVFAFVVVFVFVAFRSFHRLSSSFLSLLEKDFIFTRAVTRHFRAKMKRTDSHSLVSSLAHKMCESFIESIARVCARKERISLTKFEISHTFPYT